MICFDEIRIGDLLRSGAYGYKVLNKNPPRGVTVQTVCLFANYGFSDPAKIIEGGNVYENVTLDCFSYRYIQKAVVV